MILITTEQDLMSSAKGGDMRERLYSAQHVFTARRLGYGLAGVFAFAGVVAAANANTADTPPSTKSFTVHKTTTSDDSASSHIEAVPDSPASDSTSSTTFSAEASGGTQDVKLNVNGQDVPVPSNGSTNQTIISSDGSQTTVNTSTSQSGQASNNSSSSLNLNISSNSSSFTSGGTTTTTTP